MELYLRIKQRREELGLSQEELAHMLGYRSRSTIAKIEAGVNDIPQSKILAFAEALSTTPAELMGFTSHPTPRDPELQKTEQGLRLLARRLGELPADQRERLIQNFQDTVQLYYDAMEKKKEGS